MVIFAALMHASWNILVKGGTDKLLEMSLNSSGSALIVMFFLPFLPLPAPESLPYLGASVCLQGLFGLLVAHAYKGGGFSQAYTIMRGTAPLLTALAGVFIVGESLSWGAMTGIGLLSVGVLTLAVECVRCGRVDTASLMFSLAAAVTISSYTVSDGTGVRIAGNTWSYVCWSFALNGLPLTAYTVKVRGVDCFLAYLKKRWPFALVGGLCSALAYGISLWAMTRAPIALVAALRETSVIFGMLLAVMFLKERLTLGRTAAVLMVALGAAGVKVLA